MMKHFYIEKGQGEPLILLHGNGEDCEYFQGQMDAFSKRYHVYAVDTRGHGKTPRGKNLSRSVSLHRTCLRLWRNIG